MKKIRLLAILLLGCALVSHAQTKQDHTTSVDNYKHPNKAALARKLNLDKKATLVVTDLKPVDNTQNSSGNYKGQFLTPSESNTFVEKPDVVSKGSPNLSKDNYKAQSQNISTPEKK